MDSLLIQFRDNERRHDDLHMWIEGYSRTMDSYYLAFDSALLAGDESADKVRRVLIRLLQRWGEALAQATPTRTVYLPFDFSDEYTGCSSVPTIRRLHRDCSRHFEPRGLETLAERSRRLLFGITDFHHDALAPVRRPSAEFLRRIQESIADTESQLSTTHESSH
jgi:hypothetical protein